MSTKPNTTIQGIITSQAFGGEGILRHEGQVIFVPFAIVGDNVEVTITTKKKNFAQGRLKRIIVESPHRIKPRCPHFGICGGCQFQSIPSDYQALVKRSFVEDALMRIGNIQTPVQAIDPSKKPFEYRRHIRLHFDGHSLGYKAFWDNRIMDVTTCPIFLDNPDLFKKLHDALKRVSLPCDVMVHKNEHNGLIIGLILKEKISTLTSHIESLLGDPPWDGIWIKAPDAELSFGNSLLRAKTLGLNLEYSPKAFMQAHPDESARLYEELLNRIRMINPKKVLDLYCGIGITALLMKQHGIDVIAVELNKEAIAMAQQNERNNQIEGIEWQVGDVERTLEHLLQKHTPDAVLLNPPRVGVSPKVKASIKKYKPAHILYVSCMPATLARDCRELCQEGYQVTFCKPYDLFPQTTHVETLIQLSLLN